MIRPIESDVQNLSSDYPEWKPWLAVVEAVLAEAVDPRWEVFVPDRGRSREKSPLLEGAEITCDMDRIRSWVERLMRTAYESGAPKLATLKSIESARPDPAAVFHASLCQDSVRLREIAAKLGVDQAAFHAVTALVAVPYLQACGRRWSSSAAAGWTEGYCPLCGAWPAFAEVRGIERNRQLRCGQCGAEWQFHPLHCPYCDMTDHTQLVSLVPENGGATRTVQACRRCLGYLKSFTRLQGAPATQVILDDLASADIDIAAVEEGYRRPEGPGYSLSVIINGKKS